MQFVANEMVKAIVADPNHYTAIVDTLKPVRRHLVKPLSEAFQDPNQLRHVLYSAILAEYATDQPEVLAEMVVGAREPDAFGKVVDSLVLPPTCTVTSPPTSLSSKGPGFEAKRELPSGSPESGAALITTSCSPSASRT